jgi:lipoprotein signal peptidase
MRTRHVLAAAATLAAAALLVDQVSKTLVRDALRVCSVPPVALCDRVEIIGPLGVLRTINGDGAMGIIDASWLALVTLAAFAVMGVALRRYGFSLGVALAVGLLIGGFLSNTWDRIAFGTVTDFIDFRWGLADSGLVLNPADIALAAGGFMFWIAAIRAKFGRRPQSRATHSWAARDHAAEVAPPGVPASPC